MQAENIQSVSGVVYTLAQTTVTVSLTATLDFMTDYVGHLLQSRVPQCGRLGRRISLQMLLERFWS